MQLLNVIVKESPEIIKVYGRPPDIGHIAEKKDRVPML